MKSRAVGICVVVALVYPGGEASALDVALGPGVAVDTFRATIDGSFNLYRGTTFEAEGYANAGSLTTLRLSKAFPSAAQHMGYMDWADAVGETTGLSMADFVAAHAGTITSAYLYVRAPSPLGHEAAILTLRTSNLGDVVEDTIPNIAAMYNGVLANGGTGTDIAQIGGKTEAVAWWMADPYLKNPASYYSMGDGFEQLGASQFAGTAWKRPSTSTYEPGQPCYAWVTNRHTGYYDNLWAVEHCLGLSAYYFNNTVAVLQGAGQLVNTKPDGSFRTIGPANALGNGWYKVEINPAIIYDIINNTENKGIVFSNFAAGVTPNNSNDYVYARESGDGPYLEIGVSGWLAVLRAGGVFLPPVDHVDFTFNRPVNAATFDSTDLALKRPDGQPVPILSGPTYVGQNTWRVTFSPQTTGGEYELRIGPHVADTGGQEMNQDGDTTPGEDPYDVYHGGFSVLAGEPLALGSPTAGAFPETGTRKYYEVTVEAGKDLAIELDDADNAGANELHVSFETLPTRESSQYRAIVPGVADQTLHVQGTRAGTYYMLAYASAVPDPPPSAYTILAEYRNLTVTGVSPDRGYNAAAEFPATRIAGTGFDRAATVVLHREGSADVPGTDVTWVDTGTLFAKFNVSGAAVGTWDLVVTNPGAGAATHPYTVVAGVGPQLETRLVLPKTVGYHTTAEIYVEYANTGSASMQAPLLVVTASQKGRQAAFLTLDRSRWVGGFWTSAIPEGFASSVQFIASGATPGLLAAGESGRVSVYYAGWQQPWDFTYSPIDWSIRILDANEPTLVPWSEFKAGMRPPHVRDDAWDAIWSNLTSRMGLTYGDYVIGLSQDAVYLHGLGQRVEDISQLLGFEVLLADGFGTLRTAASASDAAVEAPGLPVTFSRTFAQPISKRFELGPLGRGWSHNWQFSLSKAADGTVTVTGPGGSRRVFQPDRRDASRYFTQAGDHATLTPLGGGAFSLREPGGLLRVFQADGKLDYVQDPNGNRITCNYSGDLLTGLVHSSGQSLQLAYNGAGRIQTITDHLSRQTTFTYDGANEHLRTAEYPDGRTATYEYEPSPGPAQHSLTQVANSCCDTRYFHYDGQGRVIETHLEGNAEPVTFTFEDGAVTATDALGGVSKSWFDHRGRLAKKEDASGHGLQMMFDDDHNLVRMTDPGGRPYEYTYDQKGNLLRSTDPLGGSSYFTYYPGTNRLASITDAKGNKTRYAYTAAGDLESITYCDGSRESWTYDASGRPLCWTNRRGNATPGDPNDHVICYGYDPDSGRMIRKTYSDGSGAEYAYDTRGNLTSARTFDAGQLTLDESVMTYDGDDRLTLITFTGGRWLSFTYDTAGRRATSEDQLGHTLTYDYDDATGRLVSITNELAQEVVHYEYDTVGRLSRKTLGNGMYTEYGYEASQLSSLTNRLSDGTPISWFVYTYVGGQRTAMATHYGTWTYTYDDLGQLTRAVLTSTDPQIPNQDLNYIYDAVGNRIRTIENGVTTEYATNCLNQYITAGSTSFVFDLDGNLVQATSPAGTMTGTYNDENRLIAVTKGTDNWAYTYDAQAHRVGILENGVAKRFAVDPAGLGNLVGEYDANGSLLAHYDYGNGLLLRREPAANQAYYTFDALGGTQQLVTATGTIANAYVYAPFGSMLKQTGVMPNPFAFVGESGIAADASGLHYMRARYYEAQLGRFLSPDPLGISSGETDPYAYVGNNPVHWIDPSGLQPPPPGGWLPRDYCDCMFTCVVNIPGYDGLKPCRNACVDLIGEPVLIPASNFWVSSVVKVCLDCVVAARQADAQRTDNPGACHRWCSTPENRRVDPMPVIPCSTPPQAAQRFGANTAAADDGGVCTGGDDGDNGPTGPTDPNEKTGPAGFGPAAFVAATETLPYRIDFENDASATAPAQQVDISDPLESNLDWPTCRLTEVAFGDETVAIPADWDWQDDFTAIVPMTYLDTNFEVHLTLGIDTGTGEVHASFYCIDPETELPPPVEIGFLPPEDGTGRGMGHISFVVKPKANLATGTEIRNVACIQFDGGEIVCTNQIDPHDPSQGTDPAKEALATIDNGAPSSKVQGLPALTQSYPFAVSWTGLDDLDGSGIGTYEVYLSVDGGPFALWLTTAETSAPLNGQPGHTYALYTVAVDNVGNREAAPAAADATTTVDLQPNVAPVLELPTAATVLLANPGAPEGGNAEYAILDETTGKYVGADGRLATQAVWQLADAWAGTILWGLTPETQYAFRAKARLVAGAESPLGPSATVTTSLNGDTDGSGHVDVSDLLMLAWSWDHSFGDPGYDPRCDFNADDSIDVSDLLLLATNWGR